MEKVHKKKIVSVCYTLSTKPYVFEWKSCWLDVTSSVRAAPFAARCVYIQVAINLFVSLKHLKSPTFRAEISPGFVLLLNRILQLFITILAHIFNDDFRNNNEKSARISVSLIYEGILTILFLIDLIPFNVRMLLDLENVERQTEFNTSLLFICLHCWDENDEKFVCWPERIMRVDGGWQTCQKKGLSFRPSGEEHKRKSTYLDKLWPFPIIGVHLRLIAFTYSGIVHNLPLSLWVGSSLCPCRTEHLVYHLCAN